MKLITYATHNSGYFKALEKSAKINGFDLHVLGFNNEWKGFTDKFFHTKKYLEKLNDKNEIVCFVDAFDVIVLGTSDELLEKYKKADTDKVIFSSDEDGIFHSKMFGNININDKKYKNNRINSGCYIGKIKDILQIYNNLDVNEEKLHMNDQELITKYYEKNNDLIQLDHNSELFYNLKTDINNNFLHILIVFNKLKDYKVPIENRYHNFIDNRVYIKEFNTKPVFLHGNGGLNIDNFVEKLNLPEPLKDYKSYYDYSTRKYIDCFFQDRENLRYNLYVFCVLVHIFIIFCSIFLIFFTKNIKLIYFIIMLNAGILSLWQFCDGRCFLTVLENIFSKKYNQVNERNSNESILVKFCKKLNISPIFIELLPFLIICYSLYKLNNLTRKK